MIDNDEADVDVFPPERPVEDDGPDLLTEARDKLLHYLERTRGLRLMKKAKVTPASPDVRMTPNQFFKLCLRMNSNQEELTKQAPSAENAAESLAKSLGFPVLPSAVKKAAKATGIIWHGLLGGGGRIYLLNDRAKALGFESPELALAKLEELLKKGGTKS